MAPPTSSRRLAMPARSSTDAAWSFILSDLLDVAADKVIRELAATGSELVILHVLSPRRSIRHSRAICDSSTSRQAMAST